MFKSLKKYKPIFSRQTFALVHVVFGDQIIYDLLYIAKKGNTLSISDSHFGLGYDDLAKKLNKNNPVILHFSGQSIINKKVSIQSNYSKEVLFGASPSDFYILEVKQGDFNFVSVARREIIDEVLQNFKSLGVFIVNFTLGPFVNVLLQELLPSQELITRDFILYFSNNKLLDFKSNDDNTSKIYKLGQDKLSNYQLSLFAALLNHLYPSDTINYDKSTLLENNNQFKQKKLFNTLGIAVLSFFLISLLLSYIVFDYYNNKYLDYEKQLYYLNNTYKQVKDLENEKTRKQAIVKASGVLSHRFVTQYLYNIGESIPETITLSELKFNPLLKKIKANEPLSVHKGVILISGKTTSSNALNNWIAVMKHLKWVKHIKIRNFLRDRHSALQFDLEIVYK